MVNCRRAPWYLCMLLYVKLLQCSGIPYIYGQLEWGAFCYMLNVLGVVVLHRSMVNWRNGSLVHVHYAICETFWG